MYPKRVHLGVLSAPELNEMIALLDDLRERRIDLAADGRTLIPVSPHPVLDDGLVEKLQHWRHVLVKILPRPSNAHGAAA
jgi:hypothetical protein